MSQAGILDVESSNPQIPTSFTTNFGIAVPIANNLEILGAVAPQGNDPVFTSASGKTVTVNVQIANEVAASDATVIGLAAFDSASFDVDANGFVTLTGGGGPAVTDMIVDASTPPGTNPVVPVSGDVTFTGAQVASGTVGANVIRTNSLAANSITWEIQQSGSAAAQNTTLNGVAHFNSAQFTVVNGFVSLLGGGEAIDSFTTDVSGPVVPAANGNVAFTGATNIFSDGSVANTMRLNLQGTNHAIFVGRGANTASANIATGTSGQILQSAGAGTDPGWTTSTYPSTNAINTLLYASAANTMTALAASNNGVLISSNTGVPSWLAAGTTGQVLTATTGSPATWQTPATKIGQINGDSGSITGATVTIFANRTANATGRTVAFINSGTTSTLTLTDAGDNILIGRVAGNATYTGLNNVGIGAGVLQQLTSGGSNTSVGYSSMGLLTSGVQNCAFGLTALNQLQTGNGNCAFGFESLKVSTSSTGANAAFGWRSLYQVVGGSWNTALGTNAGGNYTGSESNNISIANSGTLGESNVLRIGTQGSGTQQVNQCYIAGIVGVTTSNTQIVTINSSTGQLGVTTAVPIANGGTNATSFSTSNGIVKYDGTSLVTSTTAQIDSSNRMTNTSQTAFQAVVAGGAITNLTGDGTVATVVFNNVSFQQGSGYNNATGIFTAPVTGKYLLQTHIVLSNLSAVFTQAEILIVTTAHSYVSNDCNPGLIFNPSTTRLGLGTTVVAEMTAGDTARVQVFVNGGTKVVGVSDASNYDTWFGGYLIC